MWFDAPTAIEISQADVQIVPWWVYVIDQQTITALEINLQKEQQDDPTMASMPLHARKPDDIQLPQCAQAKHPHIPDPKHKGRISQWYTRNHTNRRLHQDNTRPR